MQCYEWLRNGSTGRLLASGKPNPDFVTWPSQLNWLTSLRALQTQVHWPAWTTHVPLGKVLRTDLLGLPKLSLNANLPAGLVEQLIPVGAMVGLPLLLSLVAWRVGLAKTRRDHMILQFSGFIATFLALTIIGTYFRGAGMSLVPYTIFAEK